VQIIQDLLLIQIKWTTVEMESDVRQTAGIVGKGALALAGEFYRTLELVVECCKPRNRNNSPFNEGVIFFS
jgi:hypothetical protein